MFWLLLGSFIHTLLHGNLCVRIRGQVRQSRNWRLSPSPSFRSLLSSATSTPPRWLCSPPNPRTHSLRPATRSSRQWSKLGWCRGFLWGIKGVGCLLGSIEGDAEDWIQDGIRQGDGTQRHVHRSVLLLRPPPLVWWLFGVAPTNQRRPRHLHHVCRHDWWTGLGQSAPSMSAFSKARVMAAKNFRIIIISRVSTGTVIRAKSSTLSLGMWSSRLG